MNGETRGRIGRWMQTWSGIKFYPLDPKPREVNIEDIANALGKICRFNGHTLKFYSVAEHCVHISNQFEDKKLALYGLLHDAAETYISDIPRPIKRDIENIDKIEEKIESAIFKKFGLKILDQRLPYSVKEADNRILYDEREQLLFKTNDKWFVNAEPLKIELFAWPPEVATKKYLNRFYELTKGE
jgi:uncharacterized protein